MIQVYYGNGKGKTTAALGLALRAAGAGLKVYIGQFAKGRHFSELTALKKFRNITVEQFGAASFIAKKPSAKDRELAKKGLARIKMILSKKNYGVVVLDELTIALLFKLITLKDILGLIEGTPATTELVITGRFMRPEIIKKADLASEIKEIKHYFTKGLDGRRGIEY